MPLLLMGGFFLSKTATKGADIFVVVRGLSRSVTGRPLFAE